MKTAIDQEIKGTLEHIELLSDRLKARIDEGETNTPFIRMCVRHINDSLQRLKRIIDENQISGAQF